jgi:hypothetical protein
MSTRSSTSAGIEVSCPKILFNGTPVPKRSGVALVKITPIIRSLPTESMKQLVNKNLMLNGISVDSFDRNYNLKVRPNNFLMAPNMKTVVRSNGEQDKEFVEEHPRGDECHFLHYDNGLVAALSHCTDDDIV